MQSYYLSAWLLTTGKEVLLMVLPERSGVQLAVLPDPRADDGLWAITLCSTQLPLCPASDDRQGRPMDGPSEEVGNPFGGPP